MSPKCQALPPPRQLFHPTSPPEWWRNFVLTPIQANTPANKQRRTIGVGEQVQFNFNPGLPTNATWTCSTGSLSAVTATNTLFTAPSNAATAKVAARIQDGYYRRSFKVVEPTGIHHAITLSTDSFSVGQAAAGMYLRPYIGPTNVSFYRLWCVEIGRDATGAWGYFTNAGNTPPSHIGNGADEWFRINEDNSWEHTLPDRDWDHAQFYNFYGPFSAGGFFWPIPAAWRVGETGSNSMPGWSQSCDIDTNGTMTITKFGPNTVTRTTNDVYTTVR